MEYSYLSLMELSYQLSEEIVRHALEIVFREDPNWQIAFTNPTAGPWKKIRFGKYITGDDLKFAKEEDRPDLILFSAFYNIFIVLEAKDNILKLLQTLTKSIKVFSKEFSRINGIIRNGNISSLIYEGHSGKPCIMLAGYVYPEIGGNFANNIGKLHKLHLQLIKKKTDVSLVPCISFIVRQDENLELTIHYILANADKTISNNIEVTLPKKIKSF